MKRKRLALLLAIAMTVTSLDSTAMVVSGADFSSEIVETEEVEVQSEGENQSTLDDAVELENADDDISADVEVSEEEVQEGENEAITPEPEEAEISDATVDFQADSDIATQSEEKEVQSVSWDFSNQRTTFISDIEDCYLADAKLKVTYTDGTSKILECGWGTMIDDSYNNHFSYHFVSEDGNRESAAGNRLSAGKYKVKVVGYYWWEAEKVYDESATILVEDKPDLSLFPRLKVGESNDLSAMTKIRKDQNWFVFTADTDGEYELSRYDFFMGDKGDIYSEIEARPINDRMTTLQKEENLGYRGAFAMHQGESYYVNIRLLDTQVTSINMPVRKLRGQTVPTDDSKITEMQLDGSYTVNIDKGNDEVWFSFTPEETGKYTFGSEGTNRYEEGFFFDSKNYYGTATDYRNISAYIHHRTAYVEEYGGGSLIQIYGFGFTGYLDGGHTYYFCARLSDNKETGSYKVSLKEELSLKKIEVTLNRTKIEEGANSPLSAIVKYILSDGTEETRHLYTGYKYIDYDNVDPEKNETKIMIRPSGSSNEDEYWSASIFNNAKAGAKYEVIFRNGRVESAPQEVEVVAHEEADCYKGTVQLGENPDTVSPEYDYSLYQFVPPATKEYVFFGYNNIEIESENGRSVESGEEFEKGKPYYIRLWGKVDDAETCNLKIEERRRVTEFSFVPSKTKAYNNMLMENGVVGQLTLKYDDDTVWSEEIGFTRDGYTDRFLNEIKPILIDEDGNEASLWTYLNQGTYKVHLECGELKSKEYTLTVRSSDDVKILYTGDEKSFVLRSGLDGIQKDFRLPVNLDIQYDGKEDQVTPFLGKDVEDQFGNTIHTDIYNSNFSQKYTFTKDDEILSNDYYKLVFVYTDKESGQTFESSWISMEVRNPYTDEFDALTFDGQNAEVKFSCVDKSTGNGWSVPIWYLLKVSEDQEGDYHYSVSKDNSAYTDEIEMQWKKFETEWGGSVSDVEIENTGDSCHLTQGVYLVSLRAPKEATPSTFTLSFERVAERCPDGQHSYGEWEVTSEPTCVAAGSEKRTCGICGDIDTKEIAATGQHSYVEESREASTCTTDGYILLKCKICGATCREELEMLEHQWEEIGIVTLATCTEEGKAQYQCKECKATETRALARLNHSYEWVTDKEATCGAVGSRHQECTVCGQKGTTEAIRATGKHIMREWRTIRNATAVVEGTQERSCKVCGGTKEFKAIAKLTPTVTLNVASNKTLPLAVKQSFQGSASGLAAGDKVVSWKSSNSKIATVSANGKITGKKAGTATITVTLNSGYTTWFKVKVQKSTVTTSSIKVLNKATGKAAAKKVTLKRKGKLNLTAVVAPVTSKQKVTFTSSKKSVVTVNSKGVVTAKKKGKATITVKSGKKTVKIQITVK